MNIWVGTSGFQYAEWKGTFYPEDLSTAKMLPFYAERLSTTEINYTFRRIPSAKTIQGWWDATPERFKFSLKAPQKVTHFAKLQNCGDTLRYFYQVISDLEAKLGVVLFQLPPAFKKDAALLAAFSMTLRLECARLSNFATLPGSMTKSLRSSRARTSRSASLTVKSSLRRSSRPPIMATCVCAVRTTSRRTLLVGRKQSNEERQLVRRLRLLQARGKWDWPEAGHAAPGTSWRGCLLDGAY